MSTKFKRILFDYDGTILIHKSEEQGEKIAKELGLDEEQTKIFSTQLADFFANQKYYYKGKRVTYDVYYSALAHYMPCVYDFDLTPKQVDDAINQNNLIHSKLAKGARETFEYLKERGYIICLMTNGFAKEQVANMKYNNIYDYFDRIYTWDNEYAKPDGRFMRRALDGTNSKENVVIGNDLVSDILMAKVAGVFTIGFNLTSPYTMDTLDGDFKPDVEIESFSTIMKIL